MDTISKPSITRLARRAGVKSLSDDCFDTIRDLMAIKLSDIIKTVMIVNNERLTKTIMTADVYDALKLQGYNVAKSKFINSEK